MWHYFMLHPHHPLAWSIKHPNGTTYSRSTFSEALEVANDLSSAMKSSGIEHYRCRVFKTYGRAA